MGTDVSKILFELSATDRGASSVFKTVETALGRIGSVYRGVLGGLGVGIGAGSVTALFGEILRKTSEAEREANRLTAVMRNAGNASREELDGIAEALSKSTEFDDDAIRKAETEILIFGNITGKTFRDVLRISADVASFMHTDLPSAARDVAKAIAEPETAFKLLKSAGVILTDQQKDQIRHMGALGDKAGQQEVLVQKLDAAYSGMAATINTGLVGASAALDKSWDALLKTFGKTPAVTNTAEGGLTALRILADGLKTGVDKLSGVGGIDPWAGLKAQLGAQGKAGGPLGLSPDFIKQMEGVSLPGPTVGIETPEETYAREKIARQIAAARSAIELATARDLLSGQQKILDDQHSEGLISLEDYYAARHDIVERGLRAEATAVAQGISAQNAIKANAATPEAIAGADIAIATLQAQENKAIRGANTESTLLTNQRRREEMAKNLAAAKALGEIYTQAGARTAAGEEALGDFNETMSQGSKDLKFQTELLGKSAYEQGLLTAQRQIDLQTLESAKNINEQNVTEMEALYRAAAVAKKELKELYDANYAAARSWQTGLLRGLNEYVGTATNAAEQTRIAVVNGFHEMDDALTNFVKTGKLDFRAFADSIITDLLRIQVQKNITGPLAAASGNFLGSIFGNIFGGGTQAPAPVFDAIPSFGVGTPFVPRDMLALVHKGEAIIPAAQNSGARGATYYIDARGADAAGLARLETTVRQLNGSIERRAVAAVADARLRGGSFASAFGA